MGRMLPIVFGVLCLAIGVQVFLKWGAASGLGYVDDWQTAKKEALAEKKPIILVFGGPWCPSCVQLEERVFSDERVRKIAGEFVCVHVDPKDSQDAMEFKATRFVPEVVFLTSDAKVLTRLDMNERTPYGMTAVMERVLKKVKGGK